MYTIVIVVFSLYLLAREEQLVPFIQYPDVLSRIDTMVCHQETGMWMFTLGAHKDTSSYNTAAVLQLLQNRTPSQLIVFTSIFYGLYTRVNKNPSALNFLLPKPEVTCGTVAIIIRVVLLSPYLRIARREASLTPGKVNEV